MTTLEEEAGGRKECTDSPPHPSPASNLSSGILQPSFTGMKCRGLGAGFSPQRNPLSPTPARRSSGTGSPGAGVSDAHMVACSQQPPQRAWVWGEPGGEWEELWILEDRVRSVGASWNRKASARAYFVPDGQSQGELFP